MPTVETRYGYVTQEVSGSQVTNLNGSTNLVINLGGSDETPIQFLNTSFLELESQLQVYHIDASTGFETTLVLDTDWTAAPSGADNAVTIIADGNGGSTIGSDWANGDVIRIERTLKETRNYTDWTNNTQITADQLDYSQDHTFFLVQQALDNSRDALRLGSNGVWNGDGLRSYNCAPATTNNGWVTLSQVSNLISGTETAEIADMFYWTETGDGVITNVSCTGFSGSIDPEDLIVHIDGVMQIPTTDYTVASTSPPVVTFTSPIPNTSLAHIRLLQGSVAAVVVSDAIDGDALVDDSVDESKFGFVAGDNNRVILIGTTGQPTLSTLNAAKITDFDTQVRTSTINEMAAATGNIVMGNNKITGLTDGGTGTQDACTVAQMELAVDAVGSQPNASTYTGKTRADSAAAPTGTWTMASVHLTSSSLGSDGYYPVIVSAGGGSRVNSSSGSASTISMSADGNTVSWTSVGSGTGYTANIIWYP